MNQYELRRQNFYGVAEVLMHVDRLPDPFMSDADLARICIKVSDMNIHTEFSKDGKDQFAAPFPSAEFDSLFDKTVKDKVELPGNWGTSTYVNAYDNSPLLHECRRMEVNDRELRHYCRWKTRGIDESPYERLHEFASTERPEWQVHAIFDTYDPATPHIGCTLIQDTKAENQLLRAEIKCATRIMAGRLRSNEYSDHCVVPAFVYSFSGTKFRVIQAHYEHPKLIVRKTELLDFDLEDKEKVMENIKLMVRWVMNSPTGETQFSADLLDKERFRQEVVATKAGSKRPVTRDEISYAQKIFFQPQPSKRNHAHVSVR